MAGKAWAIKLGSGGRCIPFCEKHGIVGVGWKRVAPVAVVSGSRAMLIRQLESISDYKGDEEKFGRWAGSLNRFGSECSEGDLVLYYDPSNKHVRICEAIGKPNYRDFDLAAKDTYNEEVDIWHCRKVRQTCEAIPIVDFYGAIKGKLLGPRGTFWQLHDLFELIQQIGLGIKPGLLMAKDSEIQEAKSKLEELITKRTETLNEHDWEILAADYFRAQGAAVDMNAIGGNQSVIDFEAIFDHGDVPESAWRVQVKRYQNRPVDRQDIKNFADRAGSTNLCFVSVFGFTDEARKFADDEDIFLRQAEDFSSFILSGKLAESLKLKLMISQ
jgi:predicted Mrr-cat superfamily restriction endonuclease